MSTQESRNTQEQTSRDKAKELAGRRALEFVEEGMVVGLGSGTTATFFIEQLGKRVQAGLRIRAIASSRASEDLARSLGVEICDFDRCPQIDVTVDGADEVGPGLALIKGGGGALLREKIVASASRRFIIVADSVKVVPVLGAFPLPVEVIAMASPLVSRRLLDLGMQPSVRHHSDGSLYITDEGNLILDCACGKIEDPERLAASLRSIVGLVEHGLFLGMAELALIAGDGQVQERTRQT